MLTFRPGRRGAGKFFFSSLMVVKLSIVEKRGCRCLYVAVPLQTWRFQKNIMNGKTEPYGKLDVKGTAAAVNTHRSLSCLFLH
jgi:hypothetical protein